MSPAACATTAASRLPRNARSTKRRVQRLASSRPEEAAEYIRVLDFLVANGGVIHIPDEIPFEQAALVEPMMTVLKGTKLLNLAPDDTVLVIGQGPIGLMHAALARRTGARVLTSDLFPERHAIAARYGLTNQIHAGTENVVERVFTETEGRGADAVVIAVGGNGLIRTAMDAVRPGGKVMLLPKLSTAKLPLTPRCMCRREDPAQLCFFFPASGRSHRAGAGATATGST